MKKLTDTDFHEALYVLSLDRERFDIVRKLLDRGFSARPNLATYSDLAPGGQRAYGNLDRLFSLTAGKNLRSRSFGVPCVVKTWQLTTLDTKFATKT